MAERARPWLLVRTAVGERRYQRLLLVALASILLLSLVPVVGTHVLGVVERPLVGRDHLGAMCLIALHELLSPAHSVLHVLVAVGFAWAIGELVLKTGRMHRVLRELPVRALTAAEARRVAPSGLAASRVSVVEGLPLPAFTAGSWWRPRVYVAAALLNGPQALSSDELCAVLAHEGSHVHRRDPVRFAVLRLLARALFWVPALYAIAEDIADEAEIVADDAASQISSPIAVAGALVKLGAWTRAPAALTAVGFLRHDLLERRVRRLLGEDYRPQSRLTRRGVFIAMLILSVSTMSGVVDVHALPSAAHHTAAGHHCDHDGALAMGHLFCRWDATDADCPHRHSTALR